MRIFVLSSGDGWHVQDLCRAARATDSEIVPVPFQTLQGWIAFAGGSIRGGPWDLETANRVLVRLMPAGSLEQVVFRMDVLQRLKAGGIPVLNPPAAVEACVDKYLTTARLEAAGLPVPATIVCERSDAALEAFERLGGDVVIKPLFGSEGKGITRVNDPDVALRVFQTLERLGAVLYLQRFIPHPGWDLRAFILGERVVAAMRRRSTSDWRTNVARGGRAEAVELDPAAARLACRAAAAVGAPLAGVDLLPDHAGRLTVLEVNAVPGWRALGRATGIDVAAELLRYLMELRS